MKTKIFLILLTFMLNASAFALTPLEEACDNAFHKWKQDCKEVKASVEKIEACHKVFGASEQGKLFCLRSEASVEKIEACHKVFGADEYGKKFCLQSEASVERIKACNNVEGLTFSQIGACLIQFMPIDRVNDCSKNIIKAATVWHCFIKNRRKYVRKKQTCDKVFKNSTHRLMCVDSSKTVEDVKTCFEVHYSEEAVKECVMSLENNCDQSSSSADCVEEKKRSTSCRNHLITGRAIGICLEKKVSYKKIEACGNAFLSDDKTLNCLSSEKNPEKIKACGTVFEKDEETFKCIKSSEKNPEKIKECGTVFEKDEETFKCIISSEKNPEKIKECDAILIADDHKLKCIQSEKNIEKIKHCREIFLNKREKGGKFSMDNDILACIVNPN